MSPSKFTSILSYIGRSDLKDGVMFAQRFFHTVCYKIKETGRRVCSGVYRFLARQPAIVI